jgi:hypothetical protein
MMASSYTCVCKCTFTAKNYFSQHQHSCSHTKKCLSSAISSFKQFVGCRKKPHISNDEVRPVVDASPNILSDSHTDHPHVHAANTSSVPEHLKVTVSSIPNLSHDDVGGQSHKGDMDEVDMCLVQYILRCQNQKLPVRFRDVLCQPPPTIPPQICNTLPESIGSVTVVSTEDCLATLPVHSVFCTHPNIFRLVCQYFSTYLPSHDPEEYVILADLSTISGTPQVDKLPPEPPPPSSDFPYHPYPNYSSFQLGDWYWN